MMRLRTRSTEIEIEDLKVGRIRIRVRENILDRMAGFLSPEWQLRRLRARAALQGGEGTPAQPARRCIHPGYRPPKREDLARWADTPYRGFHG
jgi:hypothetical protein